MKKVKIRHCLYCGRFMKIIRKESYKHKKYCEEECAILLREKTREIYLKYRKSECEKCGESNKVSILLVHHLDKNQRNNSISNLITLCRKCHSKIHSGKRIVIER